ncbi:hypothetical protein Tco_0286113 [Tanacetum coccineum]
MNEQSCYKQEKTKTRQKMAKIKTPPEFVDAYYELVNAQQEVTYLILAIMSLDLQNTLENYNAYDMLQEVKTIELLSLEDEGLLRDVGMPRKEEERSKKIRTNREVLREVVKKRISKLILPNQRFLRYLRKRIRQRNRYAITIKRWVTGGGNVYPAELKKEKNTSVASTSGIKGSRKLKHRALNLYMGNGMRATIEASGSFELVLASGHAKEMTGYYFYYPLENKIFIARNAKFFESSLTLQKVNGSNVDLEIIQEDKIQPSKNTSEQYDEHELGDLIKPPNYKATLSDPGSNKWVEAMNAEMQSTKDNLVCRLVDLPPDGRTVGSK